MKRKCLAIGIILLFLGTCIIPANAQDTEKQSSRGNWLYVGGSGPGNYTRIQDAIDNASDGDTVFVYDDSSPYYERLFVEHSIILFGEARDETVIGGFNETGTIFVNTDNVFISGFTIIQDYSFSPAIYSYGSNHTLIENNIVNGSIELDGLEIIFVNNTVQGGELKISGNKNLIQNNTISYGNGVSVFGIYGNNVSDNTLTHCGLSLNPNAINICSNNTVNGMPFVFLRNKHGQIVENAGQVYCAYCSEITIQNLTLFDTGNYGILMYNTSNSVIQGNTLSRCGDAISLEESKEIQVKNNNITDSYYGVSTWGVNNVEINQNRISRCNGGIFLGGTNLIAQNNTIKNCGRGIQVKDGINTSISRNSINNCTIGLAFIGAFRNTITYNDFVGNTQFNAIFLDAFKNKWENNYWGRSRIFPKIIIGIQGFALGGGDFPGGFPILFPWLNIDFKPAFKPNAKTP